MPDSERRGVEKERDVAASFSFSVDSLFSVNVEETRMDVWKDLSLLTKINTGKTWKQI